MKVAEARARFGDILDQAEAGDAVLIERKGVLFRLIAEVEPKRSSTGALSFVDDAVMSGQWGWETGRDGIRFKARRKAR